MRKVSYLSLASVSLLLLACNETSSEPPAAWVVDPVIQKHHNPVLTLRSTENGLAYVDNGSAGILDSMLDSNREAVSVNLGNGPWRRPLLSDRFAYSWRGEDGAFWFDGYDSKSLTFVTRGSVDFQDDDSSLSNGYSIEVLRYSHQPGAVSEDDFFLIPVYALGSSERVGRCFEGGLLLFHQLQADSLGYPYPDVEFPLLAKKPFAVRRTNSVRYHEGYFYLATQNGLGRVAKDGSDLQWWLRIETACTVDMPMLDDTSTIYSDSLYQLWNSPQRKEIKDVAFQGDSIFAWAANGDLWVSPDLGSNWQVVANFPIPDHKSLIKTEHFIGTMNGSDLARFDLTQGTAELVDTKEIETLTIHDVAEFRGRLFLATDGGLFSKPIEEL